MFPFLEWTENLSTAEKVALKWMLQTMALIHYQCWDVDFEWKQQRKPASDLSQLTSGLDCLQVQMKYYYN